MLIEKGANTNAADSENFTALIFAAKSGRISNNSSISKMLTFFFETNKF